MSRYCGLVLVVLTLCFVWLDVALWSFHMSRRERLSSGLVLQQKKADARDYNIALTFQDGPASSTAAIATILNAWNTVGTFCINGNLAKAMDPDVRLLKQLHKHRHELINAALQGAHPSARSSSLEAYRFLNETERWLRNIRPSGTANLLACGLPVQNVTAYTFVWGNVAPLHSFSRLRAWFPDLYLKQWIWGAAKGSILAMPDDELTAQVLPELIRSLLRGGFQFVTLSELLL
jgi:peptidoglycan/xylan/chitin deacetylase (PgdA/CDA1 family)